MVLDGEAQAAEQPQCGAIGLLGLLAKMRWTQECMVPALKKNTLGRRGDGVFGATFRSPLLNCRIPAQRGACGCRCYFSVVDVCVAFLSFVSLH